MSTKLPAIIGLTGGIATGKSTVTRFFLEYGARVIDADVIARVVVEPGAPALDEIQKQFGAGMIREDGSLNRESLGAIVFADLEARKKLNAITHPRIAMEMMRRAGEAKSEGFNWVIYDAALIVENGIHHMLQGLIVVACDAETQLTRLMERDEYSAEDAQARINSQLPLPDKVEVADWVIDNNGTLEQTQQQVANVFQELQQRFGANEQG